MQRLISSLAIVSLSLFPSSVLAQQHFGGVFYQPHHNNWQQNQFGGDTVDYEGQILTNNLIPNTDTCDWVRKATRFPCEYFYEQRNSTGYTTHYVGRPRSRWGRQNYPLHQENLGWNNNYHLQHTPSWNNRGCVYQNNHVRILCN
jgi:hypothetical protein